MNQNFFVHFRHYFAYMDKSLRRIFYVPNENLMVLNWNINLMCLVTTDLWFAFKYRRLWMSCSRGRTPTSRHRTTTQRTFSLWRTCIKWQSSSTFAHTFSPILWPSNGWSSWYPFKRMRAFRKKYGDNVNSCCLQTLMRQWRKDASPVSLRMRLIWRTEFWNANDYKDMCMTNYSRTPHAEMKHSQSEMVDLSRDLIFKYTNALRCIHVVSLTKWNVVLVVVSKIVDTQKSEWMMSQFKMLLYSCRNLMPLLYRLLISIEHIEHLISEISYRQELHRTIKF